MLRWVSRIFRCTWNHILRVTLYFGKSVHDEPSKTIYMFFFDYWTVFCTPIQFIHKLAPRSLWLSFVSIFCTILNNLSRTTYIIYVNASRTPCVECCYVKCKVVFLVPARGCSVLKVWQMNKFWSCFTAELAILLQLS